MEMFIMILIVTILLDINLMVIDDTFPYGRTVAKRIGNTVVNVAWLLMVFVPIPQFMVNGMVALHAYLGNFRFVMLILVAFCAIAHTNHRIRARWVSPWRTGFHKSDDFLMVFFSAFLATIFVGIIAFVSMLMASPRFSFALILGVL